ncbi:diacylglycerol kinase family protein [Ichthyenterobacterium sp. W332]|uniref:Diacylglycerol kinase family protein n=1 Tax=Microcosmobacter mediterraneus TaxID=3075607 RepID=A0ABU2YIL4_9FLAO|nr:diacylglycerol kinase family protein [Ichthyenterobacterium sp. W332]MDT0557642.1 diacylglycerol kinase family protein [Ichthyenterobacterium sp. W332]
MNPSKEPFFINRIKSVGYALKGAVYLISTEASIKIQVGIAIVITIAGFYFNISKTEWLIQTGMIGLVMSIEGVNTAIEYIADFIHPEHHHKIGRIKDISAGAVFLAAITAVIVAGIIYIPKIF